MTIIEKEGKIYHDEHDVEVQISNDKTKHLKVIKVKIRSDGDPTEVLKLADKHYKDGVGSCS
mgnify:CR=1 FL=1